MALSITTLCHYAECRYAGCRSDKCHYAECRGAFKWTEAAASVNQAKYLETYFTIFM
jgi:hypothetical protein